MPAVRLVDLFNAKIGSTQLVGAESIDFTYGRRMQRASNDGNAATAAADRTFFYSEGQLVCQAAAQFATILDLFRANDSQSITAEGKIAGTLPGVSGSQGHIVAAHNKLTRAGLVFNQGAYAQTTFGFKNSAAAASNSSDDEVTYTEAGAAITHASAKRGVKVQSASFDPDGAPGAITPLGLESLSLDVAFEVPVAAGDADFGETTEALQPTVSGRIGFKDVTIASSATVAQRLLDAVFGVLTVVWSEAISGTKTLTLRNCIFHEDRWSLAARRFGMCNLAFECFSQNGADAYSLANTADEPNVIIKIA